VEGLVVVGVLVEVEGFVVVKFETWHKGQVNPMTENMIEEDSRLLSLKNWPKDIEIDVAVDGSFKCKNGRAMINSALAGNGIVRLPYLYCHNEIASGELVPVFNDWRVAKSPFYLVYVQDKYQPARLKTFIDFVRTHIVKYTPTS
jgi:DNA-binding transcriptional LysR family regulator